MIHTNTPALKIDAFSNVWRSCFKVLINVSIIVILSRQWRLFSQHVKIRAFKAVSGKCESCAKLSDGRRTFKDAARRQEMTLMHQLHRGTYMGERMAYAVRNSLQLLRFIRLTTLYSSGVIKQSWTPRTTCQSLLMVWLNYIASCRGVAISKTSTRIWISIYVVCSITEEVLICIELATLRPIIAISLYIVFN